MPGTVISTAAVNSDFSDLATAMTGSLARDGQGGMTGQFLATDGTVGAPGISFGSDPDTGIRRSTANQMTFVAGGVDVFTIDGTGIVLPVGGTITGLLAITGTQTITATVANALQITTSVAGPITSLTSTAAGAASGPNLILDRNQGAPAANNVLGGIYLRGRDSAANPTDYAAAFGQILDPADGSEDGRLVLRTLRAGADTDWRIDSGALYYSTLTAPANAGEINATGYLLNGAPFASKLAQTQTVEYSTYGNLTADIPADDTPPQIGEGTEIQTVTITPTNAASTIEITYGVFGGASASNVQLIGAVFRDAVANALDAQSAAVAGTATTIGFSKTFTVSAASVTARTYRLRVGPSSGTFFTNGLSGGRLFGGVAGCFLTVTEILP